MKRLLTVLISFCIIFMFVACGNNVSDGNFFENENDPNDSVSDVENGNDSTEDTTKGDEEMSIKEMYIYVNEHKLTVTLAENVAVKELVKILQNDDITYTASDYGGFEKVGSLGRSLPTDNSQITTSAGDVVLYSGNQIVIFYGSNSWSYTRLGKISGYSNSELRSVLGSGNVNIRLSLK